MIRKFTTCGDVAGSAAERLRLLHKTFANCFPVRKTCGPPQFISRNSIDLNCDINVTHLHETSLMSRYLHVEFNIPICRVQSVLQIGENQKSILFFYLKLWNFENSENIKS